MHSYKKAEVQIQIQSQLLLLLLREVCQIAETAKTSKTSKTRKPKTENRKLKTVCRVLTAGYEFVKGFHQFSSFPFAILPFSNVRLTPSFLSTFS